MTVVLNIAFWVWCGTLALFAILTGISARGLSAEAGGVGAVLLCAFIIILLAVSLALRGLAWWIL